MAQPRQTRVLVVDGYLDGADSLAQLLAAYGHDARAAGTCAEACAAVGPETGFEPDVIVLDVRLPDGDGFDLAAELCRRLPARPVLVALTVLHDLEQLCRDAGFDHYLQKPADPVRLDALLSGRNRPV